MKSSAYPLMIWLIELIVGAIGFLVLNRSKPAPQINARSISTEALPQREINLSQPKAPTPVIVPDMPSPAPPITPPKGKKPPAQNPAARAALSLVGVDPTAELVWLDAINNPALPAQERQDLIEDLNEDGFSNKKQPTAVDLPLINARLAIIDRLMPDAMDKTNADALAEARKDLVNMQARLSR